MKLFIFESHPVQYHAPVYRALQRFCQSRPDHGIHVFYATDASLAGHFDNGFKTTLSWDEPLLEGYPATVLNTENGIPLRKFNSLKGTGVYRLLSTQRPDAVMLTGLAYQFDWAVYLSALQLRIPIWIRTETQDQAFERSRAKSFLRWCFYRLVYAQIQKALVIGKLNAEHYQRHGLAEPDHHWSPYCVVDRFQEFRPEEARSLRNQLRKQEGFSEQTTVLLFCGKLQPKKNPGILLEALHNMSPRERAPYGVLYVGTGELEGALRVQALGLAGVKVRFAGFKNQRELAPYYLASDVLVLPSRRMGETWGLVVNEALLAGRPVIVSRNAGCHADFSGLAGVRVFDGSTRGLQQILSAPPVADQSGRTELLANYSVEAAAGGIAEAMGMPMPNEGQQDLAA